MAPAYFALGYVSWNLTSILLNNYNNRPQGKMILFQPLIASIVTVIIDFILDPVWATINKTWFWKSGGPYFGIPISNFFGWLDLIDTVFLS